jgi:hypothetical protein
MANREHENLSKANLTKVIELLEQEKPITKKAACEILNISYNTARLKKLIEEFQTREAASKKMRAKLRGTPLTDVELNIIAQEYLNGEPLTAISEMTFRSIALIKKAIYNMGIPERDAEHTYFNPPMLPEDSVQEDYEKGDLVYSARYQSAASIEKEVPYHTGKAYVIYVLGKEQCYATQPYWELSNLNKVQALGVKIMPKEGLQPSYNPKG